MVPSKTANRQAAQVLRLGIYGSLHPSDQTAETYLKLYKIRPRAHLVQHPVSAVHQPLLPGSQIHKTKRKAYCTSLSALILCNSKTSNCNSVFKGILPLELQDLHLEQIWVETRPLHNQEEAGRSQRDCLEPCKCSKSTAQQSGKILGCPSPVCNLWNGFLVSIGGYQDLESTPPCIPHGYWRKSVLCSRLPIFSPHTTCVFPPHNIEFQIQLAKC